MTSAIPGWWPAAASATYEELVSYRLVGASACADRITSALVAVAEAAEGRGGDVALELEGAGEIFCRLKPDTALYRNLADVMTHASQRGGTQAVRHRARELTELRARAQHDVVRATAALLDQMRTILVHDHSSMVMRVLHALPAMRRRVVVTTGEPLGQGLRVAKEAADLGYDVTYLPDMSVARVVQSVDVFLTGVEVFYGDGSFANTVGTTMLGLLCRETDTPVLAPAEALKLDRQVGSASIAPLSAALLHRWPADGSDVPAEWSTVQYVLDAVPASVVSSYITEVSTCSPDQVGDVAGAAIEQLFWSR